MLFTIIVTKLLLIYYFYFFSFRACNRMTRKLARDTRGDRKSAQLSEKCCSADRDMKQTEKRSAEKNSLRLQFEQQAATHTEENCLHAREREPPTKEPRENRGALMNLKCLCILWGIGCKACHNC